MSTQKSWKAYRGALEMTCPAVPFMYGGVLSGNIFVGGCSDPRVHFSGVWLSDLTFLEDGT